MQASRIALAAILDADLDARVGGRGEVGNVREARLLQSVFGQLHKGLPRHRKLTRQMDLDLIVVRSGPRLSETEVSMSIRLAQPKWTHPSELDEQTQKREHDQTQQR